MGQNCYGNNLVVTAAALALEISQGMSADEMNILASLFNVIGDQLALLAATKQACAPDSGGNKPGSNSAADSGKSG